MGNKLLMWVYVRWNGWLKDLHYGLIRPGFELLGLWCEWEGVELLYTVLGVGMKWSLRIMTQATRTTH